jgi:hypothetical protein
MLRAEDLRGRLQGPVRHGPTRRLRLGAGLRVRAAAPRGLCRPLRAVDDGCGSQLDCGPWLGLFSSGFELSGSNPTVVALSRRSRWLRPPPDIPVVRAARPPLNLNLRAILSNAPNVLLVSIALVRDVVSWSSGAVLLFGPFGIVSSLGAMLAGAPTIAITLTRKGPPLQRRS